MRPVNEIGGDEPNDPKLCLCPILTTRAPSPVFFPLRSIVPRSFNPLAVQVPCMCGARRVQGSRR